MSTIPEHIEAIRLFRADVKAPPKGMSQQFAQAQYQMQCLTFIEAHIDEIAQLVDDEEFNYLLQGRMGKILNDTANALKGPPDALALHSTHDLADVAANMVASQRELLTALKDARARLRAIVGPSYDIDPSAEAKRMDAVIAQATAK